MSFDISALRSPKGRDARLVEIGEAIYLQGRESALLSHEDRFDLHGAVEALRALAVVVGPCLAGERHRVRPTLAPGCPRNHCHLALETSHVNQPSI